MSKQERRRVRVAASLGLTVLMSSAILGGVAPLTANAAEVGSEPTTTEVSTMITAPENPSDAVSSLPAGDEIGAEVVDEALVGDEEEEKIETDTPTLTPESTPEVEEALAERSEPELFEDAQSAPIEQVDEVSSEEVVLMDTWGDVEWTFKDGVLTLSGGLGVDTDWESPWSEIAPQVTKVQVTGQITAPENISLLFSGFSAVKEFDGLDQIDTSNVRTMEQAFANTQSLNNIDLTGWDVSSVTYMYGLFYGSNVISLDLSTWQPSMLQSTYNIFSNMPRLKYLNISSFYFWDSADIFGGYAPSLSTLVLGSNTLLSNVPTSGRAMWVGENSGETFTGQYLGGQPDTYHLTFETVEDTWGTVDWRFENGVLFLSEGAGADTSGISPWWDFARHVDTVVLEGDIVAPESISALFAGFTDVTSYEGLGKLNVSQTTDMSRMFVDNNSLGVLDLSDWNTSNVTNMHSMFYNCANLSQIGIENWQVENLDDIGYFLEGTKVESLNLSKWQFSGSYAYGAFASMSDLQSINISNFDTTDAYTDSILADTPNLVAITLGEKSTLSWALNNVSGKIWQGDETGHQFGLVYNGGYPDTYRLTEGTLGYYGIDWFDSHNDEYISYILLYGKPGETVSLSQVALPAGYELPDPEATVQLSEDEDIETWNDVYLDRVVSTTTRTIQFKGLPEGHLKDEVQEIKWHWDWLQDDVDPLKRNLRFYEGVVHMPQGGYDEFAVPEVEGYKADIAVVPVKTFEGEITALPDNETVTVTYTKLDSGDGGDQTTDPTLPGTNTGTGTIGGGQMTNLSTGDSSAAQDKALPQTGSQVASGLTLLGLGLLGLLGFTKRRKRS